MATKKLFTLAAVLFAPFAAIQTANAADLSVNATLVPNCTITNTPNIDFGTFTSATTLPINATTSLEINCSVAGVDHAIELGQGSHSTGSTASRAMASTGGTDLIGYELCQDPDCLIPWGDKSSETAVPFTSTAGVSQTFTIHAQIPATSTLTTPGNYTDTVSITVELADPQPA